MSKIEKIDIEKLGKVTFLDDEYGEWRTLYKEDKAVQSVAEKLNQIIDYLNNK